MIMEEVILVDEGSYSPDGSIEIKQEVTMESTVIMNDDPFAELESVKQEKPEEEQPQESEEGKRGAFNTRKKGYINYADTCNLYDSVIASLQDHGKQKKVSTNNQVKCKVSSCTIRVTKRDPHGTCRKHRRVCPPECEPCYYIRNNPVLQDYLRSLDKKHEANVRARNTRKTVAASLPLSKANGKAVKPRKQVASKLLQRHFVPSVPKLPVTDKGKSRYNGQSPNQSKANQNMSSVKNAGTSGKSNKSMPPVDNAVISVKETGPINPEEIVKDVLKSVKSDIVGILKDVLPSMTDQLQLPIPSSFNYPHLPPDKYNKLGEQRCSGMKKVTFSVSDHPVDMDLPDSSHKTVVTAKFATLHKEFHQYYPDFFTTELTKRHVVALPSTTKMAVPVLSLGTDILEVTWLGRPPESLAYSKSEVWGSDASLPTKNHDPSGDNFVPVLPFSRFGDQNFEEYVSASPLRSIEFDPLLSDQTNVPTDKLDLSCIDYLSRVSVKDASVTDRYLQLAERILEDLCSDRFRDSEEAVTMLHNAIRLARVANSKNIAGISAVAANSRFAIRSAVLENFDSPQPRILHSLLHGQFGHPDPLGPMHQLLIEEAQRDKRVHLNEKKNIFRNHNSHD